MRQLEVYNNAKRAGILTEHDKDDYSFVYDDDYLIANDFTAISLTLPKSQKEYRSKILFAFFFNMLSEGVNRKLQSRLLKIDKNDSFGMLEATAQKDTIGSISVKPIINE